MGRIFHQLTRFGKEVFPYTDIQAVLDSDGRTLKQILKNITNKFDELDLSIREGTLTGPVGEKGENGKNVELRKTSTHLQWKLENSEEWIDLIALNELIPTGELVGEDGTVINVLDLAKKEWVDNKLSNSIEDNLITGSKDKSLSAYQGLILKNSIDSIMKYIGNISFDGPLEGIAGPKGEDGKNIELRNLNNTIQWRLEGDTEWITLIDFSKLIPNDCNINIDKLLESQKSQDLENDPPTYLLTVAQGQSLKHSIDNLYDYISNLGLDTDVDITGIPGPKGEDGRSPEFREFEGKFQWRLEGDEYWMTIFKIPSTTGDGSISINDNLFSEDSNIALSANQGRILNDKINNILMLLANIDSDNNSNFNIELRNNKGLLQWKTSNMKEEWQDLIDLSNINNPGNPLCNIEIEDNLDSDNVETGLSANQGRVLNNKVTGILNYLSNIGLDPSGNISGVQGPKGEDGKSIELKRNYTHIQWRNVGDFEWIDLIPIADLSNDCNLELEEYVTKDLLNEKIIDDLESDIYNSALSARQGVILKRSIDSINELIKKFNPSEGSVTSIEIVDDLISGGKEKALSANQGKIINSKLNEISNNLESVINSNLKVVKSSFIPGFISKGDIIVANNEWTISYFEPVTPGKIYTFKGDKYCNMLRWSYFKIEEGKMIHISDEYIADKDYVTIKIPTGINFIKLGFSTIKPNHTFVNYDFFEV